MFEMLVLLINEINPHSFCFCYLFSFYLHAWSSPTQRVAPHHLLYCIFENLPWEFAARICHGYLPQEFAVGICRRNLPWIFAARICRRNLPWEFATGICRGYFPWEFAVGICHGNFVYVSESFFVYVSKSCLFGSKNFLYVRKLFEL